MNDCIFCKIANGEIPSSSIYEDDNFKVILDISPANLGHCLILPKNHYKDILEIDDDTIQKAHLLSKKIAQVFKENLNCENINILQNTGSQAGQTVFHYHIHVIPRSVNDNVNINWEKSNFSEDEFKTIHQTLSKKI